MIIESEEHILSIPADTKTLRCRHRHLPGVCQGDRCRVQTPTAAEGRHRVQRHLWIISDQLYEERFVTYL